MARQAIFRVVVVTAGVLGLSGPGIGLAVAPVLAASARTRAPATAVVDRALIASIQELLATLGYKAGPADGVAGERTRQAILAFQHRVGMPADGRPSEALYARLTRTLNHGEGGGQGERPIRWAGDAEPPMRPLPLPVPVPTDDVAATLAATAPAAGKAASARPPSPDRVRDVAPPIDREILHGVRWRVTDSNGASFELLLEAGGRVGGTALAQFWHWARSGDTIRLIFDNQWGGRVVRTGHFVGDRIVGTAEGNGRTWSWKAVRVSAKPDRAAWTSIP